MIAFKFNPHFDYFLCNLFLLYSFFSTHWASSYSFFLSSHCTIFSFLPETFCKFKFDRWFFMQQLIQLMMISKVGREIWMKWKRLPAQASDKKETADHELSSFYEQSSPLQLFFPDYILLIELIKTFPILWTILSCQKVSIAISILWSFLFLWHILSINKYIPSTKIRF